MRYPFERIPYRPDLSAYSEIIDVRSPSEFANDHITQAINLPVLSDDERREVGLLHRNSPFEARKRGAAIISNHISAHLAGHLAAKPRDYHPLIYCWRGGQRSHSLAIVLAEIGWSVHVIDGGYKAYRRAVLAAIESQSRALSFRVLNGLTGSGKTLLLRHLQELGEQTLDLEDSANHRGSLFGGDLGSSQPSQKRFESRLFDCLITFDAARPVFVEAESPKIGYLNLPNPLWQRLKQSPVVEVRCPLDERTRYLVEAYREWQAHPDRILATIDRLRPFQSGERVESWRKATQEKSWTFLTKSLLEHHYDRCYGTSGSGHYRKPEMVLHLPDHKPESLTQVAHELASSDCLI